MKEIRMLEDFGGDWPAKGGIRSLHDGQADYLVLTGKAEHVEADLTVSSPPPPPNPPSADEGNEKEIK